MRDRSPSRAVTSNGSPLCILAFDAVLASRLSADSGKPTYRRESMVNSGPVCTSYLIFAFLGLPCFSTSYSTLPRKYPCACSTSFATLARNPGFTHDMSTGLEPKLLSIRREKASSLPVNSFHTHRPIGKGERMPDPNIAPLGAVARAASISSLVEAKWLSFLSVT